MSRVRVRCPKATAAVVAVPTLEHVLDTMSYHVVRIMTDRPELEEDGPPRTSIAFGSGLGGYPGTDCPLVLMTGTIRATSGDDPWGPWAEVTLNGERCGNRHGGYKALVKAYAPVVAWVAAYHAVAAEREHETYTTIPGLGVVKVAI